MDAKELRIGNILYSRLRDREFIVTATDIVNIQNEPENVRAIPLTKEWLLKYGFIFKKQSNICGQDQWSGMDFYMKDNITLRGNLKKSSTLTLAEYFNCKIEYVHQLQNLFFALTGTELTINENSL
jgi:hypothetical protein